MNLVDSKNWKAHKNQMPSTDGPTLVVSGDVTVANSAVEASLKVSRRQDRSNALNLDLVLEEKGIGLTALTESSVSLTLPGYQDTPWIYIIHDNKMVAHITQIDTVV